MQALILKVLTYLFTLPFLAGYRTYIVAAGLLGKAIYDLSVGEYPQAVTDFLGFLAAVGVRAAVATGQVMPKVSVVLVALFLAASGGFAAEPKSYDHYGYADYAAFFEHVKNGGTGTLYVGVKDESVGSYRPHCRVESGFKGLADGVYDCTHTYGGWPQMTKRAAAVAGNPNVPRCSGQGCNCGYYGGGSGACGCPTNYTLSGCPGHPTQAGFNVTPIYVGPPGPNFLGPTPSVFPLTPVRGQLQLQRGLLPGNYGGCANGTCSGGR